MDKKNRIIEERDRQTETRGQFPKR